MKTYRKGKNPGGEKKAPNGPTVFGQARKSRRDQRLQGTMARVGNKRTGGRAILLMINVSFTISFVSFHISFRTTAHSILSFRSSIVRTYNLHSLRLHPKMYFLRKKGYSCFEDTLLFSWKSCLSPFQLALRVEHAKRAPRRFSFRA